MYHFADSAVTVTTPNDTITAARVHTADATASATNAAAAASWEDNSKMSEFRWLHFDPILLSTYSVIVHFATAFFHSEVRGGCSMTIMQCDDNAKHEPPPLEQSERQRHADATMDVLTKS